ncbi:MAG: tetratricopeptide repeat protein [Candidatus Aminicenantes bacterium]|nr:MAG: tetratricopeptide repeat protein [Candidatus Aminicenantes bacterium]
MNVKRVISIMIILMLVIGFATVLSAQSGKYGWQYFRITTEREMYETAIKFLRKGKCAEAADIFEQLVQRKPLSFPFKFFLINTYIKLGKFQEAATICEDLQKRHPFDLRRMSRSAFKNAVYSKFYYILGSAYLNLQRYPDAVAAFQRILKSRNYKVPHSSLARVYLVGPLTRDSFYAGVHYQLGTAYVYMGDKEAALEQYKKLKELDKEKSEELYTLINPNEGSI